MLLLLLHTSSGLRHQAQTGLLVHMLCSIPCNLLCANSLFRTINYVTRDVRKTRLNVWARGSFFEITSKDEPFLVASSLMKPISNRPSARISDFFFASEHQNQVIEGILPFRINLPSSRTTCYCACAEMLRFNDFM